MVSHTSEEGWVISVVKGTWPHLRHVKEMGRRKEEGEKGEAKVKPKTLREKKRHGEGW